MATDFVSGTVAAGTDATAAQYNNLRADAIRRSGDYDDSTGSANAYVLAIDSSIAAYAEGQRFVFKANFANTGAATLNVNTIGAIAIVKNHDVALEANDIESGQIVEVGYDGTSFQLLSAGGIDISSANKATLTGGTASDASQLHIHPIAILTATRAFNTASGNQTIAHGLGVAPRYIEISVTCHNSGNSQLLPASSQGLSDGSVNKCVYIGSVSDAADGDATSGVETANCVKIAQDASGNASQVATATFDATNITLAWTLTGTGNANNMNILIRAQK